MLVELDIRNLAIAEQVRVGFSPGLNVITGETGAGKSLIIEALAVLLGSKAGAGLIRTGEAAARVEGVFEVTADDNETSAALNAAGVEAEDGQLVLLRELRREGRGQVRANGRTVVQNQLAAIGQQLVDIHGQGDYMSLLRPQEHVAFLDRYAGTQDSRLRFSALVKEIGAVRRELDEIGSGERERLRRLEQLQFEASEIENAEIREDEEDEIRDERTRLGNAEQLGALAQAVVDALEEGEVSAVDALGVAASALSQLAAIDSRLGERAAMVAGLQSDLGEVAREMRSYRDEVEVNPERLEELEGRLARLANLKRKYGATLAEVVAYGRRASAEIERLGGSEERGEELKEKESQLLAALAVAGQALSNARRLAAGRLAGAVEQGLLELGMEGARFAVRLGRREDEAGPEIDLPLLEVIEAHGISAGAVPDEPVTTRPRFDRDGLEKVEFLVTMNPGEELRPLAQVASGGETSRLMLVLKSILGAADATPTLVFDEVDAGIGGRAALIVGRRLKELGRHHQVICISHLAQIAAYSETHLSVSKEVVNGRTLTRIEELSADQRIVEIAQMIGGRGEASVAAARELLSTAGSPP